MHPNYRTLQGVTILIYATALLAVGTALFGHFGFPLDDSWIHQSVARNFARFGSLGYLPDQRSSGSTSLLWTLIVSGNYALFPGLSPVIFALAINAACLILTGVLLLRIALRDGLEPFPALILAAAPALDGNYVWLAFTGMEHLLFVTLSIASIWLWLAPSFEERSWGRAIASGLCMGLLTTTRPEAVVLPAILLAAAAMFPQIRVYSRAQIIVAAVTVLAFAAIPIAVNLYTSHSLLPVTFKGRQWLFANSGDGPWVVREHLVEQWLSRPFKAIMVFDGLSLSRAAQITMLLAFIGFITLTVAGARTLIRERRWLTLSVCAWGIVHALLYAFALPASGHGGRYQPLFLALTLPLLALGLVSTFAKHRLPATVVPGAALLALGAVSLHLWHTVLARGIDHIDRTHGAVSAWVADHLPDEPIAVFDIGRVGYDRGTLDPGALVDLGGLTDPGYISFLQTRQVPGYLESRAIHYLVLPVDPRGQSSIATQLGLMNAATVHKHLLFRSCSPPESWRIPWSETRSAFQCQEVDGVEFAR